MKLKYLLYILIILLIIIYLFISYYENIYNKTNSLLFKNINENRKKEGYENKNRLLNNNQFMQPSDYKFKNEWEEIITDYVNDFNDINLYSRNVKTKSELINKYVNLCVMSISNEEIKRINDMLKTKLTNDNPCYELIMNIIPKINILKCSESLELGYPHTHKNYIVFSQDYFNNPNIITFIHETIHIDQKLNKDKYLNLYNNWNFINYNLDKIKNFDEIINISRMNPDGRDINWLWISQLNTAYWIGATFNNNMPNSIADIENRIYKIENVNAGYNTDVKIGIYNGNDELLINNVEFKEYFGGITNNNYHPNEIIAEYFTILYEKKKLNCKAWDVFNEWFK